MSGIVTSDIVNGSDEVVTVGVQRPGVQPGRWRLQLGKCAVGALALARSPRNVRAKLREEGGGKNAKIVDLSGSKGGGGLGVGYVGSIEHATRKWWLKSMIW